MAPTVNAHDTSASSETSSSNTYHKLSAFDNIPSLHTMTFDSMLSSSSDATPSSTTCIAFNQNSDNVNTNNTSDVACIQMKGDTNKFKKHTEFPTKNKRHPLFMSGFALEIYTVFVLYILIRRYWILHGITLVILAHIGDILFSWFLHMKEAEEIRIFKRWLLWWIRIGLDFATNTVEGEVVHRVLVANTLHFWNLFGKDYTINWFGDIANKGRNNALNRAKEQLNQSTMNHIKFVAGLRDGLSKRNSG